MNPPTDNYLWEYVFGQKCKDGSLAGRPGYATVEQLNANFNMSGRSRADVPVIVAFDIEKSATTLEWRGEGAPEGGSMTALVPTQLGFSYFDPMQAAEPRKDAKNLGAKNWKIADGRPITPGDRGKFWRSCGMFKTSHFCLEVEAQYHHTNGNIPPWVRSKAMFSDSGAFSFKEIVTMKMKDTKKRILDFLNTLRFMGREKGDTWKRPLVFVVWALDMEISALRFLGLNDFIPGGIHDPARHNVTEGWIRWFDLQRHAVVMAKTATMQNPNETRSLTNYILDLGLYSKEQMRDYAHNAGMDVRMNLLPTRICIGF